MKLGNGWRAWFAMLLSTAALPAAAQSREQGGPTSAIDDEWHFTFAPGPRAWFACSW